MSHKDTEWKVYERTNKGTQLTCINTTKEYQPTKHSIPVQIHISTGGKIYKELGAELKIDKELPEGPAESFEQLLADQPAQHGSEILSSLLDLHLTKENIIR